MKNDQIINRVNTVVKYFSDLRDNNLLPTEPIKLSAHTTIIDVRKFLSNTIPCVYKNRADMGGYLPYLEQLELLMTKLKENEK